MQVKSDTVTIKGGTAADMPAGRKRFDATFARGPYWYGSVIAALFVMLIGAGLIFGRFQLSGKAVQAVNAGEAYATGHFKRHLPDGEMCRFTIYDNKAGTAIDDRIARCDEVRPRSADRRPTQFNWGK